MGRGQTVSSKPDLIAKEVERMQTDGIDPQLVKDREVAQKALERHNQGTQRLVRRLRDTDDELAEIIERELLQAKREKQALQKTLADLDMRIEGQEQAAVNLKSLYDYCRQVENELAVFGFDEKRLALEALGVTVIANGRDWRMDARIPHVVEAETISSNCSPRTCARMRPLRAVAEGTTVEVSVMEVRLDDLSGREVHALLSEHLRNMHLHSPPESVHALDLEGLRRPEITFWTVWEGGELLGCGALKELDPRHAEIKSMRTASAHLRRGVAAHLLRYILEESKRRGYTRLSLETGSAEAFEPARQLYARFGFAYCGPFDDYTEDPYSVFMTREL